MEEKVDALDPSPEAYAAIMATHKPNVLGPGYIRLYILSGLVFLCSTMNGKSITYHPEIGTN